LGWKDCPEEGKEGRFKQAAQTKKKLVCKRKAFSHSTDRMLGDGCPNTVSCVELSSLPGRVAIENLYPARS